MVGLSLDHLITLFGVIEGLSLWKVPVPTAEVPSDNDKACENIWKQEGSAAEKSNRMQRYLKCQRRALRWQGVAKYECSFIPLVVFSIVLLSLALFTETKSGSWALIALNIAALSHIVSKCGILIFTYWCVKVFDKELEKLTPVSYTDPSDITKI